MSRPIRKFIALFLVVWLPLFSGNALAGVVAMQSNGGDCHAAVTQQTAHHSQHARNATAHAQHEQLAAHHEISADQPDQSDSSCQNHSICHLACCGYMANSVSMLVAEQQPNHAFTPYLVTNRTLTLPLFEPPPLARS